MLPVSVHDHLRPADADYPEGIYRVVGVDDGAVTLLRVGDGDGQREHTGTVVSVPRDELDGFAAAENPDGNRSPGRAVAAAVAAGAWSLRAFAGELAAHPVPSAVAAALLAAGAFGDGLLPIPEAGFPTLLLVGSLGLAYVGSGRLS